MPKFDVTKVERERSTMLLETNTENPRHRFSWPQAYSVIVTWRVAGRYEEIFAPDMMSMDPVYHFHAGGNDIVIAGTGPG